MLFCPSQIIWNVINSIDDNSRPIIGEKETAGSIHDAYFVNKKEGTHTLTDVSTIQFVDISFFRSFLSICGRSQRRAVVYYSVA